MTKRELFQDRKILAKMRGKHWHNKSLFLLASCRKECKLRCNHYDRSFETQSNGNQMELDGGR